MQTKIIIVLIVACVAGTAIISVSTIASLPYFIEAYAGVTLNPQDVAKTMQVRIITSGDNVEHVFDSFSKIGYLSSKNSFLLESLPSIDKKPFYEIVKKSLDSSTTVNPTLVDVKIDLYTGNYDKLIQTQSYSKCKIDQYVAYSVDTKGQFRFLKEDASDIEIREVTKFDCTNYTIEFPK